MKVPENLTKEEKKYVIASDYLIRFERLLFFLLKNTHKNKEYSLLEFGCRNGMLIKFFRANGLNNIKCYGIDNESDSLKRATRLGMIVKKCDLNWQKIPFDDEMFDYIVSFELLEHVPFYHNHFAESKRLLHAKGKILLTTPNIATLRNRLIFFTGEDIHRVYSPNQKDVHFRMFTMKSLVKLFKMHGFIVEKASHLISHRTKKLPSLFKQVFPSCGDILFCIGAKEG